MKSKEVSLPLKGSTLYYSDVLSVTVTEKQTRIFASIHECTQIYVLCRVKSKIQEKMSVYNVYKFIDKMFHVEDFQEEEVRYMLTTKSGTYSHG